MLSPRETRKSLPISRAEFDRLSCTHILHDFLNTPGFVLVTLRVIRLKSLFILHIDALLQALGALFIVFICVGFRVVRPYPFG